MVDMNLRHTKICVMIIKQINRGLTTKAPFLPFLVTVFTPDQGRPTWNPSGVTSRPPTPAPVDWCEHCSWQFYFSLFHWAGSFSTRLLLIFFSSKSQSLSWKIDLRLGLGEGLFLDLGRMAVRLFLPSLKVILFLNLWFSGSCWKEKTF